MSFNKDAAIIAQNSATVAAHVTAAIITANPEHATTTESALELFDKVRVHVFNGSIGLAGAESAVELLESTPSRGGGGSRPSQRVGQSTPGDGPGSVVVEMGKHRGKTIAAIDAIPADEAGKNSGRSYLEWIVEKGRNEWLVKQVKAYLAAS